MRRREFITLLGGAAAAWPLSARAQQTAMPVIGFLNAASPREFENQAAAFRQGLREGGFVEGRNVAIEYRWAEGQYDKLPALATDLIRRQVAVIAAIGAPALVPAKAATATIPIVFYIGEDPIELGVVSSFNRPGGNITGVAYLGSALLAKRLELLRELVPNDAAIAVLVDPKNPNAEISARDAQGTGRMLGQQIRILNASTETELATVFATLVPLRIGALLIAPDNLFNAQVPRIAALAVQYAIPASHQQRTFPAAGGLMSYGASQIEGLRQTGVYTSRILKGEKPSDLPVMQPTKFELVLNLKAAKALGLTVPASLLAVADEVIE
jgi:putative ABC transport system substrate-binding protein